MSELKTNAYKYSMHYEDGTVSVSIVEKKYKRGLTPFGKRGIDFDPSYEVTCEPLYTHPLPDLTDEQWKDFEDAMLFAMNNGQDFANAARKFMEGLR